MTSSQGHFDYIVVGLGGIGSGALYWLSRRSGNKVLGLEQFNLAHENGGSQDHSRIIRLTYHDVKYTRLVRQTYEAFAEVERESGLKLVHKTGSLDWCQRGTVGEDIMRLYAESMDSQNIKYDHLTSSQLKQKFPQITPADDTIGLYQADGGLVDAALANSVHVQLAMSRGAVVKENCPVTKIDANPDGSATVHTTQGVYSCRKVIVTAGAWVNHVLGSVGVHIPLKVTQEQVTYYATPHIKKFTKENFPVFIFHGELDIYGFPAHVNSGSKIGIDAGGPVVTAGTRTFVPDPVREEKVESFLKKYIPEFLGPKMYTKTCLYAMTLDRDFVVDTLASRGKPQVVVCNGAGHAFKFASLLGKILSEIAVDGQTQYNISAFKLERPAIVDANYVGSSIMGKNPSYSKL